MPDKKTFLIVFAVLAAVMFPFTLIAIYGNIPPKEPTVTYAEFPFKLVYMDNGQRKEIDNTLICNYRGISGTGFDDPKRLDWEEFLANNQQEAQNNFGFYRGISLNDELGIYFDPGDPTYYMGAEKTGGVDDAASGYYHEIQFSAGRDPSITCADDVYRIYKIKIISWQCVAPIQNTFR